MSIDAKVVGRDGAAAITALRSSDPGVVVLPGAGDDFYLGPDLLQPGDDDIVLERVTYELIRGSV